MVDLIKRIVRPKREIVLAGQEITSTFEAEKGKNDHLKHLIEETHAYITTKKNHGSSEGLVSAYSQANLKLSRRYSRRGFG